MQKINYYIILAFLLAASVACKKNEHDPAFKEQARLQVGGLDTEGARQDSISFTYAIWPTTLADTTVTVIAQAMGNASAADRVFKVVAGPGTTAQPFFYPAYRAVRKRVKGRVTRSITKSAKKVAAGG